jgi:hypothetical protein
VVQDIPHTFTNQPWLQDKAGQDALRRVLSAYSVHNTRIGYCRSMNNIVAMLLVCMNRNEENAFWLLAALVEDILHPSTYAKNLEGCQVSGEQRQLQRRASWAEALGWAYSLSDPSGAV